MNGLINEVFEDMTITSIIITVLLLGVIAAVHEIGHFFVARAFGIKVYELSIFVGPALFSWKKNGVEYSLRLIPFGAYVRFSEFEEEVDDEKIEDDSLVDKNINDDDPSLLINQPRWKRLVVAVAGPIMNVVLGVAVLTVLFSVTGFVTRTIDEVFPNTQLAQTTVREGDQVIEIDGVRVFSVYDLDATISLVPYDESVRLTMISASDSSRYEVELIPESYLTYMLGIVRDNQLTEEGGWYLVSVEEGLREEGFELFPGDIIMSINGISVSDQEATNQIIQSEGRPLEITYIRDGQEYSDWVNPILVEATTPRGLVFSQGNNFFGAFKESAVFPVSMFRLMSLTIRSAVSGDIEPYNIVAGPVGITSMVSDVVDTPGVESGIKTQMIVLLTGVISIAVAFTNLLPIPGLDGNVIVLLVVELIRGKKISKKTENVINFIGFALVVVLVVFALLSDLIRITR